MGKSALKSKTLWVNLLVLAAGIAGYVAGHDVVADNPQIVAIAGAVVGAINIVLRFVTTEPLK
jgi:hypothetical protein